MDSSSVNLGLDIATDDAIVLIKKTDIEVLKKEITRLKTNLTKVLSHDIVKKTEKFNNVEKELEQLQKKVQEKSCEVKHWKSRFEKLQKDCQKETQEKISLQSQMQEVSEQLNLQADYFASMGSTYCTALWRVSQNEQAVINMLSGPKVCDLFTFVSNTLRSYIQTYHDDMPDEDSTETRFTCALCGIITNVAASAFGRDVLSEMPEGIQVIDTMISMLIEVPTEGANQMKNLILMSLYNLTINKHGLKYISSQMSIINSLVTLLKEECSPELKLHSLLLIQSLITDQERTDFIQHAKKLLTFNLLEKLCRSPSGDVRNVATEIKTDLRLHGNEQ